LQAIGLEKEELVEAALSVNLLLAGAINVSIA
jgi:hypothetical protein